MTGTIVLNWLSMMSVERRNFVPYGIRHSSVKFDIAGVDKSRSVIRTRVAGVTL